MSFRAQRAIPVACGIGALLYYLSALSPHAWPGESATAIAQHAGLSPFLPVLHPLWTLIAHAFAHLPVSVALPQNLLSACCVAAAIALFARILANIPHAPAEDPDQTRLATLGACASAAALAVLPPIAEIATRATPASLELLLLTTWLAALQTYCRTARASILWFAAALTGPAMLEFTAFPIVCIITVAVLCWVTWCGPAHRWRTLAIAALISAVSAAATLAAWSWLYAHAPVNAWRADLSPGSALLAILQRQWLATRLYAFGPGWLVTATLTVAPWLIAASLVRQPIHVPLHASKVLLCAALLLPPTLLLWDAPIAPWRLFPWHAAFLLPHLLVAAAIGFGLCLAYVWCRPLTRPPESWRPVALPAVAALAALLTAGAAVHHWPALNTRAAVVFADWAHQTVTALGPRDHLVTDGITDDLLRIAARDTRTPLTLLDLSRGRQRAYLPYLAACFEDPRLRTLASVGLVPLLRDWLATDAHAPDRLAILPQPDLWLVAGLAPIPRNSVYIATRAPHTHLPGTLAAAEAADLARWAPSLRQLSTRGDSAGELAQYLLTHFSRHASNLGLALENLGDPALAAWAYTQALAIQPGNIAAGLNLAALDTNALAGIDALLTAHRNTPIPLLTARYGHIRTPEALELLRASRPDATPAPAAPAVRAALATYLAGDTNAARTALGAIIDADPTEAAARVLLGMIAYQHGDIPTVRRCIDSLRARGKEALPLLLIEARLYLREGETDRARQCLARLLTLDPAYLPALEESLALELDAGDDPDVTPLLQPVLSQDPGNALANFGLGIRLYRDGKPELAEAAFRRSLERRPAPDTLNNLAWLLQERAEYDGALALVEESLRLDPDDAAAWDTRGVTLMRLGRLAEAATALTRALELAPAAAETRHHLAELQQQRGTAPPESEQD